MKTRSAICAPTSTGLAALAFVLLHGGGSASAVNFTITVDAARQTAGNPRFWAASVGTGTASLTLRSDLQTQYKIGNRELGFQRVRGHGVLNDDMGIYKGPGSYDWTKLDMYLAAIVAANMRPLMELSLMPTALAAAGNSHNPPGDYNAYKQFIQAVVQHCVDTYGMADVSQWYWEVWNEPDYSGFWTGTIDDYYRLYDNAVDAITAVLPAALVGGPGSTWYGPIGPFLQHCRNANKRVTFVSSHSYPGAGAGGTTANAANLVSDNDSRLAQITGAGHAAGTVKSFNTEWNSSYSGQGGLTGDVVTSMDNHWNVGFILKSVKLLSDKNVGETPALDVFSYWALSDVFDESSGPSGSYILAQGGNLPFGKVFGLMTFQGVRKAPFNAFKMLTYLGPRRLRSDGGTGSDGVDAMATLSANGDEVQILVYNYFATLNSSGMDMVTVNISNLPAALAGKDLFVTHFRADETHSNPYNAWVAAGRPTNPTEAQWQAMKAQQHLALLAPVSKATVTTTYTIPNFAIPRQAASLIILGLNRPVTGRNAFVEIEGEDYDGQSGATKEDSNDSMTLGQSLNMSSGGYAFYNVVDFGDTGAGAVALRVNVQSSTTLTLRTDSQTGTVIGTCNLSATGGSWAAQTCSLARITGVHTLYVSAGGNVRLNSLKFQPAMTSTGTGGSGGAGGAGAGGRGGAGGSSAGAGGSSNAGGGGSAAGGNSGAAGSAGPGTAGAGMVSGTGGASSAGAGGSNNSGSAGSGGSSGGSAGSGGSGAGGNTSAGAGGTSNAGVGGTSGSGGATPQSGGSGCACAVAADDAPSGALFMVGVAALGIGVRRRRREVRARSGNVK